MLLCTPDTLQRYNIIKKKVSGLGNAECILQVTKIRLISTIIIYQDHIDIKTLINAMQQLLHFYCVLAYIRCCLANVNMKHYSCHSNFSLAGF